MHYILSVIFGLVMASPANAQGLKDQLPTDLSAWTPQLHDRFIADTEANVGYIIHEDGAFTMFRIGSGMQRVVNYGGNTYNATTPSKIWHVQSISYQSNRIDFGKDGLFLRLYADGSYSPYGIHATSNIDDILSWQDRYKSFGCILVSYKVLDILEQTYLLNGKNLDVATIRGIENATMLASK